MLVPRFDRFSTVGYHCLSAHVCSNDDIIISKSRARNKGFIGNLELPQQGNFREALLLSLVSSTVSSGLWPHHPESRAIAVICVNPL